MSLEEDYYDVIYYYLSLAYIARGLYSRGPSTWHRYKDYLNLFLPDNRLLAKNRFNRLSLLEGSYGMDRKIDCINLYNTVY